MNVDNTPSQLDLNQRLVGEPVVAYIFVLSPRATLLTVRLIPADSKSKTLNLGELGESF